MAENETTKINIVSAGTDATKTAPSDDSVDPYEEIKKELATRFTLLPEELQKVIVDDAYQAKLFTIAKANKLTYEELGELELETTMVLLGMTKPQDYRDELQVQLKKNDPEIDTIVKAVNEQVFAPIRTELERVYAAKKDVPVGDFAKKESYEPVLTAAEQTKTAPVIESTPKASVATPAPLAQAMPAFAPGLSSTEKTVLEKTGVVISETKPITPISPNAPMPNRSDLLKSIENPPKTPVPSIVADKLGASAPIIPATKTTDYSVVKTPAQSAPTIPTAPTAPVSDPYREPIN